MGTLPLIATALTGPPTRRPLQDKLHSDHLHRKSPQPSQRTVGGRVSAIGRQRMDSMDEWMDGWPYALEACMWAGSKTLCQVSCVSICPYSLLDRIYMIDEPSFSSDTAPASYLLSLRSNY